MKKILLSTLISSLLVTSVFAGGGGDILRASTTVDNLEYQFNDEKVLNWDALAYIGYDINKIYIYSEGEKAQGESASSENELVYSRAVYPFWDLQIGLDYDKTPNESKTWGVLAIQGLAPYFFETRAVVLIGDDGNVGFRFDVEYEALITQKLILTPSFALDAYTKDARALGIGSGLSNITAGARLRYEFIREFAPYVGVEWSKNFADTNTIAPLDEAYVNAGVRFWF